LSSPLYRLANFAPRSKQFTIKISFNELPGTRREFF